MPAFWQPPLRVDSETLTRHGPIFRVYVVSHNCLILKTDCRKKPRSRGCRTEFASWTLRGITSQSAAETLRVELCSRRS